MSRYRENIDDALGAAHSFLHALRIASEAKFKESSEDCCAFLLLIDRAQLEIANAQDVIDNLLEDSK